MGHGNRYVRMQNKMQLTHSFPQSNDTGHDENEICAFQLLIHTSC